MDPLTHGVLGGTFALLGKRARFAAAPVKAAVLAGVLGGMAPDLDVLIKSSADPLLGIEYHRFFTHALLFIPLGGLLIGGALWPLMRRYLGFWACVWFAMLGYSVHGLLDAMTNYGTHLFWPFTMRRESWSLISIIDPLFTLPLLALLLMATFKNRQRLVLVSVLFAAFYLGFGYTQRERATEAMHAHADALGHVPERFEVKPSFGNNIVWRVQYEYGGRFYIAAVRVLPWTESVWYAGGDVEKYNPSFAKPELPTLSTQARDVERFTFFSDGWVASYPPDTDSTLIADMRFSMLPNSLQPLWGIRINPHTPNSPVSFDSIGKRSGDDFPELWLMIKGE